MKKIRTKQEYVEWTQKIAPKTHKLKNMIMAFITGGIICTIGQVILSLLVKAGMVKEDAASLTTLLMIFMCTIITGHTEYDDIGRIGGAGAAIPVTGFANSIVSPAMEYKKEGYIMGVGAKMFLIAGPVLVYGIVASIAAGILYYIFTINV